MSFIRPRMTAATAQRSITRRTRLMVAICITAVLGTTLLMIEDFCIEGPHEFRVRENTWIAIDVSDHCIGVAYVRWSPGEGQQDTTSTRGFVNIVRDVYLYGGLRSSHMRGNDWFISWTPGRGVHACLIFVPVWPPAFACALVAALSLTCFYRGCRRKSTMMCRTCGYDLRGCVDGRCSECGTTYIAQTSSSTPTKPR